ncbi:MAG TPA: hypothetical protein VFT22_24600 [Kofleriaceae bacterium]|nr:hypothetical protein [Kofleriaceae bacterium]
MTATIDRRDRARGDRARDLPGPSTAGPRGQHVPWNPPRLTIGGTTGSPAIDAGCPPGAREPDGTPRDIGAYGGPLAAWAGP